IALGGEVQPTDVLGQQGAREHATGAAEEILEKGVLARGQDDAPRATAHFSSGRIEGEIRQAQDGRALPLAPAKQGPHTRQQLIERERLGEIVVGAVVEPGHLVGYGVAGGEEQHRGRHAPGPRGFENPEPVEPGQHHVEDHEVVGRATGQEVERGGAVGGLLDGIPLLLEPLPDETRDLPLVLHDEDAHLIATVPPPPRRSGGCGSAGNPAPARPGGGRWREIPAPRRSADSGPAPRAGAYPRASGARQARSPWSPATARGRNEPGG